MPAALARQCDEQAGPNGSSANSCPLNSDAPFTDALLTLESARQANIGGRYWHKAQLAPAEG